MLVSYGASIKNPTRILIIDAFMLSFRGRWVFVHNSQGGSNLKHFENIALQ
jgi:hypothetical protein